MLDKQRGFSTKIFKWYQNSALVLTGRPLCAVGGGMGLEKRTNPMGNVSLEQRAQRGTRDYGLSSSSLPWLPPQENFHRALLGFCCHTHVFSFTIMFSGVGCEAQGNYYSKHPNFPLEEALLILTNIELCLLMNIPCKGIYNPATWLLWLKYRHTCHPKQCR